MDGLLRVLVCVMEAESSCDKPTLGVRGGHAVTTMLSWQSETARLSHGSIGVRAGSGGVLTHQPSKVKLRGRGEKGHLTVPHSRAHPSRLG